MRVHLLAPLAAIMAFGVALTLYGEWRAARAWQWAGKPIASAAFVALAVVDGIPQGAVGLALLGALLLSFLGDLLLIPAEKRVFRAGILVFLLAHVAFIVAFLATDLGTFGWQVAAASLVILVPVAVLVARWLLPLVPAALKGAVVAYMVVISAMVAVAAGAVLAGADPRLLAGALLFYVNDILVARDRFAAKHIANRAIGLPMYYVAMILFALAAATYA